MSGPAQGHVVGKAICEAIGIDADSVARIQIDCQPGKLVDVRVWYYVSAEAGGAVGQTMAAYRLVPTGDA